MKLIKEKDIRQEYSVLLQEAAMKGGGANPNVRSRDNNEPKQEAVFKFAFMFAREIQFVSCNACKRTGGRGGWGGRTRTERKNAQLFPAILLEAASAAEEGRQLRHFRQRI